jgi:UPF0042 nucleotide-binding protein
MTEGTSSVRVVVVTGLSGSGKSLALRALEDAGYYCVDNLPLDLIPTFYDLCERGGRPRVALVVDVRGGERLPQLPGTLEQLRLKGGVVRLLYLDAGEEALIHRFSETRRPHPLAPGAPLLDGIRRERELVEPLKAHADLVVDTSGLTVHQLRAYLMDHFRDEPTGGSPHVTVVSFGYRYGVPENADLVFDVRFVPNPHFVPGLRERTGEEPEVLEWLEALPIYREFRGRLLDLVDFLVPAYEAEGKAYLTVAFGCTGGRHRSVALARQAADHLRGRVARVDVLHRDVGKS